MISTKALLLPNWSIYGIIRPIMNRQRRDLLVPRPHHPLVENLEATFLGCLKTFRPQLYVFPLWETINQWLIIAALCLLMAVAADLIWQA